MLLLCQQNLARFSARCFFLYITKSQKHITAKPELAVIHVFNPLLRTQLIILSFPHITSCMSAGCSVFFKDKSSLHAVIYFSSELAVSNLYQHHHTDNLPYTLDACTKPNIFFLIKWSRTVDDDDNSRLFMSVSFVWHRCGVTAQINDAITADRGCWLWIRWVSFKETVSVFRVEWEVLMPAYSRIILLHRHVPFECGLAA